MALEDLDLSTPEGREEAAAQAVENAAVLDEVLELLGSGSRARRQKAASIVALAAGMDPQVLAPAAADLAEAVLRPEDQTRWECLNALTAMAQAEIALGTDVLDAAEEALFDEHSGIVREAAFRFFAVYGSMSPEASDQVWSNMDEAIQCFHGNPEFSDMLTNLVAFAESDISAETAAALAARMKFDSETARGTLRMRSEQIVQICTSK